MFKMYDKFTEEEVNVYNVRDDKSGYPQFLVRLNGVWIYKSAKNFKPYEETKIYNHSFN